MKTSLTLTLLLLLLLCGSTGADERLKIGGRDGLDPTATEPSYGILLALSGGGARGMAVIGVLRAFEEHHIQVHALAGTSMGGIIGGLYAAGYSPDQLDSIARTFDFTTLFSDSPPRRSMLFTRREGRDRHLLALRFEGFTPVIPSAITGGQRLSAVLVRLTTKAHYQCGGDFRNLPIPFAAVTTDIVTGQPVILDTGSLADAMRATMAIPLAFAGLDRETRILMDGGITIPIPVSVLSQLCDSTRCIVAINTTSDLLPKNELNNPFNIANQVTTIMSVDRLNQELALADIVIQPNLNGYSLTDYDAADSLIAIGYREGSRLADSIIALCETRRSRPVYHLAEVSIAANGRPFDSPPLQAGEVLDRDELIRRLRDLVRSQGAYSAEITIKPAEDSNSTGDTTSIYLFGDLVIMEAPGGSSVVRIENNTVYSDSLLLAVSGLDQVDLTYEAVRDGIAAVERYYHADGYDLASIDSVTASAEDGLVLILDEAIVDRVDPVGNDITRDWYIRSSFPLQPGVPYSTREADQGISNIYGTDLFSNVTVMAEPTERGPYVKIAVEEKPSRQIRLGWHWDDEYESEEFAEFVDDNVAGIGLEYAVHTRYSPNRKNYFMSIKSDRILETYLTARVAFYHTRLKRQLYTADTTEIGRRKEETTGAEFIVGQQIARLGTLSAGLTVEEVAYEYTESGVDESYGLRRVHVQSVLEDYNRLPFPTVGRRYELRLDAAGKFLGGDVEYTRLFTSLEAYVPLGTWLNYHPRLALGVSRSGLPPSEQFFLGGLETFFGFRTHQLSGDKMALLSNELRIDLPLSFYIGVRHDLGEVYTSSDQIKLRNLRNGIGGWVGIDSPIGPIMIGYGVADSDIDRFYINVGPRF